MIAVDLDLADVQSLCPKAHVLVEGSVSYIHLPSLKLQVGSESRVLDALLRPSAGPDGYTSRLFLSEPFPTKGQNWTTHRILEKTWHAFSFNNVPAELRLIEILANHLAVLK